MSEANHTPGPWEAVGSITVRGQFLPGDTEKTGPLVALLPAGCASGDARLIAAAPELLEFAEEVRRSGDTRLASMAIAVIAKAKEAAHA